MSFIRRLIISLSCLFSGFFIVIICNMEAQSIIEQSTYLCNWYIDCVSRYAGYIGFLESMVLVGFGLVAGSTFVLVITYLECEKK